MTTDKGISAVRKIQPFPGAAVAKYHTLTGLNHRSVWSRGSGGQTKIQVVRLVPSEGCEDMKRGSLAAGGSLSVITWHSPCSYVSAPKFPLFIKTQVILNEGFFSDFDYLH